MPAEYVPKMRDEAVRSKTGKSWAQWFAVLDRWGATERAHAEIAAHLAGLGVPPWWSQNVTVEYERARGLRAVGQRVSGEYEVSAQRSVSAAPAAARRLFDDLAWVPDPGLRRALASAEGTRRASKTAMGVVLRFDVELVRGARTKVDLTFEPKGRGTAVRLQHTKLASASDRDDLKARWAKVLDAMRARLDERAKADG